MGKCIVSVRLGLMLFCPGVDPAAIVGPARLMADAAADKKGRSLAGPCTAPHIERRGDGKALERDEMSSKGETPRASSEPAMAARSTATAELGPMPTWNLGDLYPGPKAPDVQADLEAAADAARRMKERYQGKLVELAADGAALAEAIIGLRAPERADRQARLLRRPALRRRHIRSRERQVLRRHPGEADRHHHRPDLLRARAQPDRRGGAGSAALEVPALAATGRGSRTCARRSPTSSTSSSSGCSTRSR